MNVYKKLEMFLDSFKAKSLLKLELLATLAGCGEVSIATCIRRKFCGETDSSCGNN